MKKSPYNPKYISLLNSLISTKDILYLLDILGQPHIHFKSYKHILTPTNQINAQVSQIHTKLPTVLTNKQDIFYLFKLYTLLLDQLVKLNIAYPKAPNFRLLSDLEN